MPRLPTLSTHPPDAAPPQLDRVPQTREIHPPHSLFTPDWPLPLAHLVPHVLRPICHAALLFGPHMVALLSRRSCRAARARLPRTEIYHETGAFSVPPVQQDFALQTRPPIPHGDSRSEKRPAKIPLWHLRDRNDYWARRKFTQSASRSCQYDPQVEILSHLWQKVFNTGGRPISHGALSRYVWREGVHLWKVWVKIPHKVWPQEAHSFPQSARLETVCMLCDGMRGGVPLSQEFGETCNRDAWGGVCTEKGAPSLGNGPAGAGVQANVPVWTVWQGKYRN